MKNPTEKEYKCSATKAVEPVEIKKMYKATQNEVDSVPKKV